MIKRISLVNYKSFKEFDFEIQEYANTKNIALIYGENGAGKSNLVSTINFLKKTINTFGDLEKYNELLKMFNEEEFKSRKELLELFMKELNLERQIADARRIGTNENMELTFQFDIEGKNFIYSFSFDKERVIKEHLYGPLATNATDIFKIEYKDVLDYKLNANLFAKEYSKEVEKLTKQYFGKHTFLSIINNEIITKNKEYIEKSVNENLLLFIKYLKKISTSYQKTSHRMGSIFYDKSYIRELDKGSIEEANLEMLKKTKEALNNFFTSLYSNVKSVEYKTEKDDNKIKYELYFNKIIGGDITDVPFEYESRGTKKLLDLFPYLINLLKGEVVVIDELEVGIHDVLMSTLVEHLTETEDLGQLIATTHNTMLLEIVDKKNVYILDSDDKGNYEIYNLTSSKIQKNHSLYNNYKKGSYGGVPIPGYFDFGDIKRCLENSKESWEGKLNMIVVW